MFRLKKFVLIVLLDSATMLSFLMYGKVMSRFLFLHPKYWPLWLLLVIFFWISFMPRRWLVALGRWLGRALVCCSTKLKHVIASNIRACFPDKSDQQYGGCEREAAEELGISLMETFWAWFQNTEKTLQGRFQLEGYEHVQNAMAQGKGIIVLACHHGAVDINGALLSKVDRGDRLLIGTYRQTDAVINRLLRAFRAPFSDKMISAGDQRSMVRALRKQSLVWYAPDIEVKNKASAFVDFMGVQASTTLAVSRLAKATGAVVIPFGHYRLNDDLEYKAVFYPPLSEIPSTDLELDARRVNCAIEQIIEPHPLRYWWAIKRFKNRPQGDAPIY